jgi:hypothetical protein
VELRHVLEGVLQSSARRDARASLEFDVVGGVVHCAVDEALGNNRAVNLELGGHSSSEHEQKKPLSLESAKHSARPIRLGFISKTLKKRATGARRIHTRCGDAREIISRVHRKGVDERWVEWPVMKVLWDERVGRMERSPAPDIGDSRARLHLLQLLA